MGKVLDFGRVVRVRQLRDLFRTNVPAKRRDKVESESIIKGGFSFGLGVVSQSNSMVVVR